MTRPEDMLEKLVVDFVYGIFLQVVLQLLNSVLRDLHPVLLDTAYCQVL